MIVPNATYLVEAELAGGERSTPMPVDTWLWGDADGNDLTTLLDAQAIVRVFQGLPSNATPEAADIEPCLPNQVVNLIDAQQSVRAFQGMSFVDFGCSIPCE